MFIEGGDTKICVLVVGAFGKSPGCNALIGTKIWLQRSDWHKKSLETI